MYFIAKLLFWERGDEWYRVVYCCAHTGRWNYAHGETQTGTSTSVYLLVIIATAPGLTREHLLASPLQTAVLIPIRLMTP